MGRPALPGKRHVVCHDRERYDLVDDRRDIATRKPRAVRRRLVGGRWAWASSAEHGLIIHPKDAPHPEFPATLGLHPLTGLRKDGYTIERLSSEPGQPARYWIAEALARYVAEVTPSKKCARQERNRIAAWRRDPIVSRPLADITTADLAADAMPAWPRAGPRRPSATPSRLSPRSTGWPRVSRAWPSRTPWPPSACPDRGPRDRRPEPGELERISAADHALAPWITLPVETALRLSELCAVVATEIAGSVLRLRDSKNGRGRAVAAGVHPSGGSTGRPGAAERLPGGAQVAAGIPAGGRPRPPLPRPPARGGEPAIRAEADG